MAGNSIILTGGLPQTYFLLPDLWVCKPCTSYVRNIPEDSCVKKQTHAYVTHKKTSRCVWMIVDMFPKNIDDIPAPPVTQRQHELHHESYAIVGNNLKLLLIKN